MTDARILQTGDQVPHFAVATAEGEVIRYSTLWQTRNLVLVTVPPGAHERYVSALHDHAEQFLDLETACIVTATRIAGVPTPGVIVADRWGEIVHIAASATVDG